MKNLIYILVSGVAFVACNGRQSPKALNFTWVEQGGGSSYDRGEGIALDGAGNSYVIGTFSDTAQFGKYTLISYGFTSEDVFIAKYNPKGDVLWVKKAGGGESDAGRAIAADRAGNVCITGSFMARANFDVKTTLKSAGSSDVFIAKYDTKAKGKLLWAKAAGGSAFDEGTSIATDSLGNSIVTGFFHDNVTFGAGTPNPITLTSTGKTDLFIAKYDSVGNLLWAKRAGGAQADTGKGIAVDRLGNSFVTGVFSGTAHFDTQTRTSYGSDDIFIAKYDATGKLLWVDQAGGRSHDCGASIAIDRAGDCYVTGTISDTARFGMRTMASADSRDAFIAKYDSSGNLLWSKHAGGPSNDHAESIAVDQAGHSYVTGVFSGTARFDQDTLKSTGGSDIFLARYSEAGKLLAISQGGDMGMKEGVRIATYRSGRSLLTGEFSNETIFGSERRTSTGGSDVFVAAAAISVGGPPTDLWASPRDTSILLTWKDNSDDEIGFLIERKRSGENTWTELKDPGANSRCCLDNVGLSLNKKYSYKVRAKYPQAKVSIYSLVDEVKTDSIPSLAQHSKGLEIDNVGGGVGGWSRFEVLGFDQLFRGHLQIWTINAKDDTVVYDGNDKDFKSDTKIKLYGSSAPARAVGTADENTAAAKPYLPVAMQTKEDSLVIEQFTYQNDKNWVLAEWNVHNIGARAKPVKLALYLDADVGGELSRYNRGDFDTSRKLVYLHDSLRQNYVGMALVRDTSAYQDYQISAFEDLRTPDNAAGGERARKDLFARRTNGKLVVGEKPRDLTMTLVSNLKTIASGKMAKVMYAIAAAKTLADLDTLIDVARRFAPCASPYFWADVNCDTIVDEQDIQAVVDHWNTKREDGEPKYNPRADVVDVKVDPKNNKRHCGDGVIDIWDLQAVADQVPKLNIAGLIPHRDTEKSMQRVLVVHNPNVHKAISFER